MSGRVYVVDTGVLVEYLDLSSPLARRVEVLYDRAVRGEVSLCTVAPVVSELLYVASRFYERMGLGDPNARAREYLLWLESFVGLKIVEVDSGLALEAGELKKRLKLALTDCMVIACARRVGATPLFRKLEKEMEPVERELRELGVEFLEAWRSP